MVVNPITTKCVKTDKAVGTTPTKQLLKFCQITSTCNDVDSLCPHVLWNEGVYYVERFEGLNHGVELVGQMKMFHVQGFGFHLWTI